MALTPTILAPQGRALAPVSSDTVLQASQALAFALYSIPTIGVEASQAAGLVVVNALNLLRVTQVSVYALVLPGTRNNTARAWGFSLDGHEFYVLRVGDAETLVLDLTTGKWADWDSLNLPVWRAHQGAIWKGMGRAGFLAGAASQIVAGDDTFGVLWTLDPSAGYDEGTTFSDPFEYFERRVTTGAPLRMRTTVRNNAVFMIANLGSPALGLDPTTVELRTSDDNGKTYQSQGVVTIADGNFTQEILWRSLGVVRAPGRIFEFTDYGATVRIDSIDAQMGDEGK